MADATCAGLCRAARGTGRSRTCSRWVLNTMHARLALINEETPRYLIMVDKHDEAWQVLQRLHHDDTDPTDAAAHAEMIQITRQVSFDKQQKAGYVEMFRKPSWRKRSVLVMFLM